MLPRFGSATNPTDVTGQVLSDPDLFDRTLRRVVEDPNTESLIIQFANRGPDDARARAELLAKTIAPRRIPTVISFLADVLPAAERRRFAEQGLVCARDPADAVRYIDWLYRRRRADLPVSEPAQGRLDAAFVLADVRSWPDLMGLLASAGIRTPAWSIIGPAQNPDEAVAGLAFPLAVKALPEDADHKTEHGLVRLRLRDAAEVRDAVAAVRARLGRPAPVLAQEMVSGVEAVVAVLQDPDFGPVLAIGTGGVGVELFQDIGYLSLPAAASEVRGLIARLRLGRLLAGFRGAPAGDTEALVVAALALADLFQAARGRWAELEVNPLIVLPTGEGAVAVDILIKPASAATVA
jgi:acyl-CoA synthetase (NDP forming)